MEIRGWGWGVRQLLGDVLHWVRIVEIGGSSAPGSRIALCEVSEDDGFARSSVATEL